MPVRLPSASSNKKERRMKRLSLLALALIAASCSRADLAKPRIGLAPRSDEAAGLAAMGAMGAAGNSADGLPRPQDGAEPASDALASFVAEAKDKAELEVARGLVLQSLRSGRGEALLDTKIKALAIDASGDFFMLPLVKQAKAERVPIVFFGLEPPRDIMRSWDKLFFVGTRRSEYGAAQGEIVADYWKATPSADRDKDHALQYISLAAEGEDRESDIQEDAAAKALAAAGVPSVRLAQANCEDEAAAARKKSAALIAAYGDRIEAFLCRDDELALGAAEAVRAAGYAKGKRRIPVVGAEVSGGEASAAVLSAIESEAILGAAVRNGEAEGKAVFDVAAALARGKAPSSAGWRISDAKYVWVPCRKLTKQTLPPVR